MIALRARRAVTVRPFRVRNDVTFAVRAAKCVHFELFALGDERWIDSGLPSHPFWHAGRGSMVDKEESVLF